MNPPCADMECRLKVHAKCDSCMMKTWDVLRSICGVYSVEWDAKQNVFTVSGEVDPSILLKTVLRSGEHAELINVKLKHPQLRPRSYNYGPPTSYHMPIYDHGYHGYPGYGSSSMPYRPYNEPYNHYNSQRIEYYPNGYNTYDYQNRYLGGSYPSSYPSLGYNDSYHQDYQGRNGTCSIM